MSKGFYLGSIAGAGISGVIISIISSMATLSGAQEKKFFFLFLALPFSIYAIVIAFVLWYKGWKSIQDGHARTTPGKAVGFLFIPLFGLYWIFQAFWGFSKDYNSFIKRHEISVSKLPEGLFLTSCILNVAGIPLGFIPVVGWIFSFVRFGFWIAVMSKVYNAVNNLVPFEANLPKEVVNQTASQSESKLSGLAIAALICAVLGIIPFCGFVLCPVGIIIGIIALVKIKSSDGKLQGKGMAVSAISVGIVFFILWILISIAIIIPAFINGKEHARKASNSANMLVIDTSLQVFMLDRGKYPETLAELEDEYIKKVPIDAWGRNYIYNRSSPETFELFSLGPDGVEGSYDDISLNESNLK